MVNFALKRDDLAGLALAMSKETVRYFLGGICYQQEDNATLATLAATDGHRLHAMRITVDAGPARRVILPAALINSVLAIVDKRGQWDLISVTCDDKTASVWLHTKHGIEPVTISAPYLDGVYPHFERIIPTTNREIMAMPTDYSLNPAYTADAQKFFGRDPKKSAPVIFGDSDRMPCPVFVAGAPSDKQQIDDFIFNSIGKIAIVMPMRLT